MPLAQIVATERLLCVAPEMCFLLLPARPGKSPRFGTSAYVVQALGLLLGETLGETAVCTARPNAKKQVWLAVCAASGALV